MPKHSDRLLTGETLTNGQCLKSSCLRYELIMQNDGNVVLYDTEPKKRAVWSTKTSKNGVGHRYTFAMQGDRHIVLYKDKCVPKNSIWTSKTNVKDAKDIRLVLQSDGCLVGYDSGGRFWGTKAPQPSKKTKKI